MKIMIASENPVKINAAANAFDRCLGPVDKLVSVKVSSEVSDQPVTDEETLLGARNRVKNAMAQSNMADFFVGIEGGVETIQNKMFAFAWVVVSDRKRESIAKTSMFCLPEQIRSLIVDGRELGEADDFVFGKTNSKQHNGAVGLLTHDLITRQTLYEQALILALIPFLNRNLYPDNE